MKSHTYSTISLLLFIFTSYLPIHATHITGGDISYVVVDSTTNLYEITLSLSRDCNEGQAPFDMEITLFVFNRETGALAMERIMPSSPPPSLVANIPNGCLDGTGPGSATCVERGQYQTRLSLAPSAEGYDLGWARCCLSNSFDNIQDPLSTGLSFSTGIPGGQDAVNSTPTQIGDPYVLVCANKAFELDYSFEDPDGDSLSYTLAAPFSGLNTQGKGVGNPATGGPDPTVTNFNLMGPPPYVPISFAMAYSTVNPFGGSSSMIDPQTGMFRGEGVNVGIYLFMLEVSEFRNGRLINTYRQQISLEFMECQGNAVTFDAALPEPDSLYFGGDAFLIAKGDSFCFDFSVTSPDSADVITLTAETINGENTFSNISGPAPLTTSFCWKPDPSIQAGLCYPVFIRALSNINCVGVGKKMRVFFVCIENEPLSSVEKLNVWEKQILLFPNPGKDLLNIESKGLPYEETHISILGMDGRRVYENRLPSGFQDLQVETAHWPTGIYLVRIEINGAIGVKRWLKE